MLQDYRSYVVNQTLIKRFKKEHKTVFVNTTVGDFVHYSVPMKIKKCIIWILPSIHTLLLVSPQLCPMSVVRPGDLGQNNE